MQHHLIAARAALLGSIALLAGGCGTDPVLLDDAALGAVSTRQNPLGWNTPGWTWCSGLAPDDLPSVSTALGFGSRGTAGASIIDPGSGVLSGAYLLDRMAERGERCVATADRARDRGIEPLTDLTEGAVGWRTHAADGTWGEYVLLPVDGDRVLAVGFVTSDDEAPVDLDELVELARAGVDRFS